MTPNSATQIQISDPPTLPAPLAIILQDSWYTVSLHPTSHRLQCTCAEFQKEIFCEHVRKAWANLEPTRARRVEAAA